MYNINNEETGSCLSCLQNINYESFKKGGEGNFPNTEKGEARLVKRLTKMQVGR